MIAVSTRQRGNPILDHVRNVPYEFVDGLVPDYGEYTAFTLCVSVRLVYMKTGLVIDRSIYLRVADETDSSYLACGFCLLPVLGSYTCALYISLRYHLLHPTYLIRRIKELRK